LRLVNAKLRTQADSNFGDSQTRRGP
jgi:hypothetical protein